MAITMPAYIEASGVAERPPKYDWKLVNYDRQVPKIEYVLDDVTFRGNAALAAGVAEWAAWRLAPYTEYRAPLQFIEAVWAGIIDTNYTAVWKAGLEPEPRGPVDKALFKVNQLLSDVFDDIEILEDGISLHVVYLTLVARHVMPDRAPFDAWFKFALDRVAKIYRRKKTAKDHGLGDPVPRTALDPAAEFTPARATDDLRDYLAALEPRKNPYLRTPQAMKKAGFKGEPYKL